MAYHINLFIYQLVIGIHLRKKRLLKDMSSIEQLKKIYFSMMQYGQLMLKHRLFLCYPAIGVFYGIFMNYH